MTVESTQRLMDRYFAEMENGDIADAFADDVTWTTIETGAVVRGRSAVRDHVNALHRLMADTQSRELAVTDGTAYLEGDCLAAPDAAARTAFCLVYDVNGDQITAMRLYGSLESMVGAAPATVPCVPSVDSRGGAGARSRPRSATPGPGTAPAVRAAQALARPEPGS